MELLTRDRDDAVMGRPQYCLFCFKLLTRFTPAAVLIPRPQILKI